ncbi:MULTISPECIES: GntR family transcriptional regulator [unclassified Gilliamella]|uniref:GntR family transcriptional regulator n=1 Tax=unclassified Gilliamella TaxID=2685620 RepID=UPI002269CFB4|nr:MULTISPECIES: GntR family transcriptional regulator [unclassified Gilliamella]MCX8601684.1 GntR family transcriptional regulator [Gilliamella sp. B3722]MCX8608606.1 GntR family transcriptional regulator [Gilliamella sp. B3771]MCX8610947.1 GntR family transcriptional regulator [Gilliamella sp. B3891]MCX8613415.1 GntR family transcriptional regulator [Gilliamella sp. B3773]MCX8615258.1 GntR family transcriptional regulator [Gilliamella sp. B3770]
MEYRDIASKTDVEEQIRANPKIIKEKSTERGLAEFFKVSRTTVRKALHDLAMESYIFQADNHIPNHNVFEINMLKMSSFSEEIQKEENVQIEIKVLSNQIIKMPAQLRSFFGSNQQLIRIIRQRLLGNTPLSYEINYLPSEKFTDLEKQDLNNVSLYEYLKEHYHFTPSHGREEITYEAATEDKAQYLAIAEGTPIYKVSSYSYDNNFQPFEHTDQYLIGNRFRYHLSAKNIFNYEEKHK